MITATVRAHVRFQLILCLHVVCKYIQYSMPSSYTEYGIVHDVESKSTKITIAHSDWVSNEMDEY